MNRVIQVILIIATFTSCNSSDLSDPCASLLLINQENLDKTKTRIQNNDPALKPAFDQLIIDAEKVLSQGPFTVTDKEKLPPSGDRHDYASYSRYWWPDPDQPDGLPYIRKDGETNPASQSLKESDRQRIGALGRNSEILGLAYYFTGD